MKKLIALNLFGLLVVLSLAALLARNAADAVKAVSVVDSFTAIRMDANEVRTQMIAMSDAMRGFLLNPANQDEFAKKKQADHALAAAVKRLLAESSDPEYISIAGQVGKLDEEKLDPIENRILELASHDVKAATKAYFDEYVPIRTQQAELVERLRGLASSAFDREVHDAAAGMARVVSLVWWIGGGIIPLMIGAFGWSVWTTQSMSRRISAQTSTPRRSKKPRRRWKRWRR
jgi:CHASE3 domain sensor protein